MRESKMSLEQITLAGPIRERLRRLKTILPGREELIYKFGETFVEALGKRERITPAGLYNIALQAEFNLVNKITSDTIERLSITWKLNDYLLKVITAVCSKEFVAGVEEYIKVQGLE